MIPQHNMQIHSILSNCASREMTIERIINEAERGGLATIGISDHIDLPDPARQNQLLANFEIVEKLNPSMNVRVGCEASQIAPDTIVVDKATAQQL
ncbi:MAG: hypothetical protein ACE1ZS_06830, partial [Candidatus Poribacteria bacterium]